MYIPTYTFEKLSKRATKNHMLIIRNKARMFGPGFFPQIFKIVVLFFELFSSRMPENSQNINALPTHIAIFDTARNLHMKNAYILNKLSGKLDHFNADKAFKFSPHRDINYI